jgi:hypothetical protein
LFNLLQCFQNLILGHAVDRACPDFRLVDVDVALGLTTPELSLHGCRIRAVVQSHVSDLLQVPQVTLIVHAVFFVKLISVRLDGGDNVRTNTGVGHLVRSSVRRVRGIARIDGGLAHCDLSIFAD